MTKITMKIAAVSMAAMMAVSMGGCGTSNQKSDSTAISSAQETTEADSNENTDISSDFNDLLLEIFDTKAGSAGSSERVEAAATSLSEFIKNHGSDITLQDVQALAADKLKSMKKDFSGDDFKEMFQECLDEVVESAKSKDSSLDTDVAFNQLVNGIQMVLDEMK